MKRCAACGAFYDLGECPNEHRVELTYPSPPPPMMPRGLGLGSFVNAPYKGRRMPGIIVSFEDGLIGVALLKPHVRLTIDDLKEP